MYKTPFIGKSGDTHHPLCGLTLAFITPFRLFKTGRVEEHVDRAETQRLTLRHRVQVQLIMRFLHC